MSKKKAKKSPAKAHARRQASKVSGFPLMPLGNRVILKPMTESKTASGIIIPDTVSAGNIRRGKIVAVGMGTHDEYGHIVSINIKIGENVLFLKKDFGDEIETETGELIVDYSRILAVIK